MKQYVIWLILLPLCSCEYVGNSDSHAASIQLMAENPSSDYKEVMKNLCNNWHSPISYLKKRGYMPTNIEYKPKVFPKKKIYQENIKGGENYFFFSDKNEQKPRKSITLLENEEIDAEKSKAPEVTKIEPNTADPQSKPPEEMTKNDTTGIISKVKNKFLSIFSKKNTNKDIPGQVEETFDLEDPEFLKDYIHDDEEYDILDRRIFARSVSENPPPKQFNSSNENILSYLQDPEIRFIKSFINWFKQYKDDLKFLSMLNSNITTTAVGKNSDLKDGEIKSSSSKSDTTVSTSTKPTDVGSNVRNSTESGSNKKVISTTKSANATSESNEVENGLSTTVKTNKVPDKASAPKNISSSTSKPIGKNDSNDFTVELNINQKNGTGEVSMGGDKTTQCAPLRLNDMSFDLEWNKINTVPQNNREKASILDLPYISEPQGQSLAAKFLQEANSYPVKSDEYLKPPYSDDFLDSQQSLPSELEVPLKSSTKREVGLPSFGKHGDIYSFPEDDNAFDENPYEASPKRRIKGRVRGRNKKKLKHKHDTPPAETFDVNIDLNDDTKQGTDFDSFDELKDIQFRVNDDEEQAISTFISNLNSPPEVFSFDVDKFLRSAEQNMEPKAPVFDFQSPPETRTYYEFQESPSVENEKLPLIEPLSDDENGASNVNKRSRTSPEKRDLLRQYIKGVSSAINHNFDDGFKMQRSTNYDSDAIDSIKPNEKEDSFIDSNYFVLNEGIDHAFDVPKQDLDVVPTDYSSQSLEIDLDLAKKFRDLNIGKFENGLSKVFESKNVEQISNDNNQVESNDE
ncbi:uncharacterized protein LOC129951312 [Eupeodes corollae]|uniref:uncharacterized protein LOC129951312 n=1 Tax=Eupeodes corollae TaxID=290404 RepID=UPI002491CB93|nr:uncharacterized protein LOC129951312 [Eupeodes corollae]